MRAEVTDVVLRDGLQDENVVVTTDDKTRIARELAASGIASCEVASFVNPARVPQMADAAEVVTATEGLGLRRSALALNARGVHRAAASGVEVVQIVTSAGGGHSRANTGRDVDDALSELADAVRQHPGARFMAGVSTAFVCPFDGEVAPEDLVRVLGRMAAMGVDRVGLADTVGIATPEQVVRSVSAVRDAFPHLEVGLHLHDANGQALDTVDAAVELGIRHYDSAVAGLGGCPFAPGAHGNLATERLVAHLHSQGIQTGIDEERLATAVALIERALARGTAAAAN